MKYYYCNRCQIKTISFSCPVCERKLWLNKLALAAALWLTAAPAQAMCWPPRYSGGVAEQLYDQCQEQERLADEMHRQNRILEQQRLDEELQRSEEGERRAYEKLHHCLSNWNVSCD